MAGEGGGGSGLVCLSCVCVMGGWVVGCGRAWLGGAVCSSMSVVATSGRGTVGRGVVKSIVVTSVLGVVIVLWGFLLCLVFRGDRFCFCEGDMVFRMPRASRSVSPSKRFRFVRGVVLVMMSLSGFGSC